MEHETVTILLSQFNKMAADIEELHDLRRKQNIVKEEDKPEFLGQIIDIFEDFLTEKKVIPFNKEPQEDIDPDNPLYIYGDDYYRIEDALSEVMKRWNIIKE